MRVSEGVKLEAPCLVAGGAGAGGGGDPKRPARLVAASVMVRRGSWLTARCQYTGGLW